MCFYFSLHQGKKSNMSCSNPQTNPEALQLPPCGVECVARDVPVCVVGVAVITVI